MQLLRGLRLNCYLAALVPGVVAIVALWLLAADMRARATAHDLVLMQERLALVVDGVREGQELAVWHERLPSWRSLALLRFDADGEVAVVAQAGLLPDLIPDAPPPELAEAAVLMRAWRQDVLRVAAPVLDAEGHLRSIVYGEHVGPQLLQTHQLYGWSASILLISMLLAGYLGRRIYGPILAIDEQARAALDQRPAKPGPRSVETAAIAASVDALAKRYRETASREES